MSIFGNNSGATNEVSPNTFQTPAAGVGKPKTTVSSKGRTIKENVERATLSDVEKTNRTLKQVVNFAENSTEIGFDDFMNAMQATLSNYEQLAYMAGRYGSAAEKKFAIKLLEDVNNNTLQTITKESNAKRVKLDEKLTIRYEREINHNGEGFSSTLKKPKWASNISDKYWAQ